MNSISAIELSKRLSDGDDILLVDVRESFEHDHFNIGGINIPLASIFEHLAQLSTEKETVIYCQKGIRSQIAIQRLQQKSGYTNLINLSGGMDAWKKDVSSSDRR